MELREAGHGRRRRDSEVAADHADRDVVRTRLVRDADTTDFADRDEASRDLELLHVALRERLVRPNDSPRVARRDREEPVLKLRVGTIRRYAGVTDALIRHSKAIHALETHGHEPVEHERVGIGEEDRSLLDGDDRSATNLERIYVVREGKDVRLRHRGRRSSRD